MPPPPAGRLLGYGMAAAVLLLDQVSKWLIIGPVGLPQRVAIELLPIFQFVWVRNYGVSMGLLVAGSETARWLLVGFTAAIAAVVAVWLWRESKRVEMLALGAILGGALGNIADRARLGYVADFLNLHFGAWSPFFVFNVADAAISIGVVLLVIRAFLPRDARPLPEKSNV